MSLPKGHASVNSYCRRDSLGMGVGSYIDRALALFDRLAKRASPYVPFTAPYEVRAAAKGAKGWSILDLGCGRGEMVALLLHTRKGEDSVVGADIWLPDLQVCQGLEAYDSLVLCDVRNLPFREKSFDVVICLELVEHLAKSDAIILLTSLERIARRKIVLSLPVGTHVQHAYAENPYQEHRSSWTVSELRHLGYRVRVTGIRNAAGETGITSRLPSFLLPFWRLSSASLGPIVNLFPRWAGHMVCTKILQNEEGFLR